MLNRSGHVRAIVCLLAFNAALLAGLAADSPYEGAWELTIPGGGAGWLSVLETNGGLQV